MSKSLGKTLFFHTQSAWVGLWRRAQRFVSGGLKTCSADHLLHIGLQLQILERFKANAIASRAKPHGVLLKGFYL